MLEGAKILVTGGAGFIGTALCRELADHNEIRVFDTLRRRPLRKQIMNKPHLKQYRHKLEFWQRFIRN